MPNSKPRFRVGQVVSEQDWSDKKKRYVPLKYGRITRIYWDDQAGKCREGGWVIEATNLSSTHESWYRPLTAREIGPRRRKEGR